MASSSDYTGILPPIVGSIVTEEEYSTIYVNCNPDAQGSSTATSGRSTLENPEVEVIFPDTGKAKADTVVPLIGGSIVTLKLNNAELNTSRGKSDNNDKNLTKYRTRNLNKKIKKIPSISVASAEESAESSGEGSESTEESAAVEFVEISNLIEARLEINKALSSMPSLSEQWYNAGIPSLVLSRFKSTTINSAAKLQKEIDKKAKDKIRLSGLRPIGTFKFVPIEILKTILDILANTEQEDFGLANYVGISGTTFAELAKYLDGYKEDGRTYSGLGTGSDQEDKLIQILLEIFPIFHIDENYIDGEDIKADIGYFTAHDDTLYIKMPDLSGRDSSGYSSNLYGIAEDDVDEYITFCFEMAKFTEYSAVAFDYVAPPVLTLSGGDEEYPTDESDITITVEKEGLDESDSGFSFYLSPIVDTKASTKVKGFKESSDAVEMFTAPVLTKCYLKDTEPTIALDPSPASPPDEFVEVYGKLLKHIQEDVSTFDPENIEIYSNFAESMLKNGEFTLDVLYNRFDFKDLGIPMSVSLSDIGISNLSELLGELNRPEILLGVRGSGASNNKSDEKFFKPKTASARDILASNRPNIILDTKEQIPANWIKLSLPKPTEEDDEWELEIPYKTGEGKPGLDIYNDAATVEFALYAVDGYGQIVRAPGQNVKIRPKSSMITILDPNGFGVNNAINLSDPLGTASITGDGLEGITVATLSSDYLGENVVATLEDGVGGVTIKSTSDKSVKIKSDETVASIVGAAVGSLYMRLVSSNGISSNPRSIYISEDGARDGPDEEAQKITFDDPFGFSVKKFGKVVHSIPIIMDGTNSASITLEYKKKIFTSDSATLYAYIAVSDNDNNLAILKEDVGWTEEDGEEKAPIKKISIETEKSTSNFYIPTALEYEFGSSDFERKDKRKAVLKFLGSTGQYLNLSRFADLKAPASGKASNEYPAYILLTNNKLSDTSVSTLDTKSNEYAVIPIGSSSDDDESYSPFISAPHVLGLVTQVDGNSGSISIESSISREALTASTNELDKKIRRLDVTKIKSGKEQNYRLVACDSLTRLAVVIRGPDEPNLKKLYSAKIGSKSLKGYKVSNIEYAGDNLLVVNYKNINDVTDEGWVDITVTKKDKRFNVTYDSTLYNRTTVTFSDSAEMVEGSFTVEESEDTNVLLSGEDRIIPLVEDGESTSKFVDSLGNENASSIIFPMGKGAPPFSPFPLIPAESYKDSATNSEAYFLFSNPIKVYPSVDLVFGAIDNSIVYGMALSDAPVDENGKPGVEVISISTNGNTSVAMSLEDIGEALEAMAAEASAALESAKQGAEDIAGEVTDLKETLEDTANQDEVDALESQIAAKEAEAAAINKTIDEYETSEEAAAAALEAARQQALDGGTTDVPDIAAGVGAVADGITEGVDFVMGAVGDALGALSDALSLLQTISDTLSSLANMANQISDAAEAGLASVANRPSDFIKVNIKHVYIDKGANISSSYVSVKSDKTVGKLVVSTKFTQVAAIRFNIPEIIELRIKDKGSEPYMLTPPRQFSSAVINSGDKLFIKTICATENTKIEIGGFRVKTSKGSPFEDGEYRNFITTVPDLSQFSLFGSSDCLKITMTNSNENRMRLVKVSGNDIGLNLDKKWGKNILGGKRNKAGPATDLQDSLGDFYLRFTSVKLEKANIAKEFLQSFCDMSFHLTAELALQLRNFKVLLVPIKVIFCIIDVICALLHPIRLVFAIIRLFLCLYDLILLLPQLSVPAMYLAILLHILELLLCVILKILGILNAINEIIAALQVAIEQKNYASIMALEETLNEHLFSLEADLSVLEPILTILALFLELLGLLFSFPCQVGADDDPEACIDPSQLAGLILGKVAPFGTIAPDALLPLAQGYTVVPIEHIGSKGNTPPDNADPKEITDDPAFQGSWEEGVIPNNILVNPSEMISSVIATTNSGGTILPSLLDSMTGENKETEDGGFFSDVNSGGAQIGNVDYRHLRFNGPDVHNTTVTVDGASATVDSYNDFQATFATSFTKSKKAFAIWTGPDPRIVEFQFKGRGETNPLAFGWPPIAIFFRKKIIDILQTIDSPPSFLMEDGGEIRVASDNLDGSDLDFISPIDGAGSSGGVFLEQTGSGTFTPKPLTATIELQEPGVNEETKLAEFTPVEVTKTFGNIPMVALVDDDFNVYFIEDDGIVAYQEDGVWKIESITAKMINFPSAPKKKFSKEDREVFEWDLSKFDVSLSSTEISEADASALEIAPHESTEGGGIGGDEADGEILIKCQANAEALGGKLEADAADNGGKEYEPEAKETGMNVPWSTIMNYLLDDPDITGNPATVAPTVTWINTFEDDDGGAFGFPVSAKEDKSMTFSIAGSTRTIEAADIPFPGYDFIDFAYGTKKEQKAISKALDSLKVFDYPSLYFVDVRQVADDIAAACGASGPMELLLDLPGFEDPDELEDSIKRMKECTEEFIKHFKDTEEDEDGIPKGVAPRIKYKLANGMIPDKTSIPDAIGKFRDLQKCCEDEIDVMCKFVINPLNTSFKLLNDDDETPLTDYINPEQKDLKDLIKYDIIDELDPEGELEGFPTITGAMEYASGIGDLAIVEVGDKALIKIIPRDCYDEPLHATLDLTEKIKIDFLKDETGSAELVEVTEGSGELIEKDDTEYSLAISAKTEGRVVIKATVCSMVIQAVTDRGIISTAADDTDGVDCIDDVETEDSDGDDIFAPGALMKVDRTLTILFVPPAAEGPGAGRYGDADREESARSAKPGPQKFGTKLEN